MTSASTADSPTEATITLPSLAATRSFARRLARAWRAGDVIALNGDLGAGKTELARAAIQAALGDLVEVPSPTFTLVQIYHSKAADIWHFDLYRLSGEDEVVELGWLEAQSEGVVLVEWPDRLGGLLPGDRLDVSLAEGDGPDARVVTVAAGASWRDRLPDLAGQ
ncbi:MAG: tRNA (adenosine(37)-N6)-threonylcarbamoyltransferase complex ATPase subunit type 1 TsaE [Pseudomonadota bacterium]